MLCYRTALFTRSIQFGVYAGPVRSSQISRVTAARSHSGRVRQSMSKTVGVDPDGGFAPLPGQPMATWTRARSVTGCTAPPALW